MTASAGKSLAHALTVGYLLSACTTSVAPTTPEPTAPPPPAAPTTAALPPEEAPEAADGPSDTSSTQPPTKDAEKEPEDKKAHSGASADGEACSDQTECASGICEGEGCGPGEGRCVPLRRACTRDLAPFCSCDGTTFRGSGSCPLKRFKHRGACKS